MILRPGRPASPPGPPTSPRPGAANDEPPGRFHVEVPPQRLSIVQRRRDRDHDHVLPQFSGKPALGALLMLGRDQNLLHRYRYSVAIPDGDLRLAVRPEEGQHPGFAHMRELPGKPIM